ncbi:sphingomyelin phosphodiesterase-like [Oppia nitens]|uniref:sphingomyelin phosphodiesterase-like n=1 Tax=Oppia nitens TaxID=1686743 RepID=UPI0023DAA2E0|nr:sphingomyelin phosphodiesterase-like [Oppia nitens]
MISHHIFKVLDLVDIQTILNGAQKGVSTSVSCKACTTLIGVIFSKWIPITIIANIITQICTLIYAKYVCEGYLNLFKAPLDEVRHKTRLTASEICAILLGNQCLAGEASNNVILHLTDIHLDTDYVPLTDPNCGAPYCCRHNNNNKVENQSQVNDKYAGLWGSYHCDGPKKLMDNLFASIDWQSIDWIYWTGDVTPHNTWEDTRDGTIRNSQIIIDYLKMFTNKTVISVFGNHISVPVGTFSPKKITGKLSTTYLYEEMTKQWSQWLPTEALSTFLIGGYYTMIIKPGFKIIVLNTNYCSRLNIWTYYDPIDPDNQLNWLYNELELAETAGQLVHIVGHIPPDNRECTQSWLYNYMAIVERFSDTIVGQFFGHTHYDEFRIYYSNNDCNKVIGFAILSPSVTSFDALLNLNPAYRIIKCYENGVIQDIDTYAMDLRRANSEPDRTPDWPFEYSMANDYSMRFTNRDFDRHIENIKRDNYYLQLFYSRYTRFSINENQYCNTDCKTKIISDIMTCNAFTNYPKPITSVG